MRPTFKIWDTLLDKEYKPTCMAYAGMLDELLLNSRGQLIKRIMVNGEVQMHNESMFPGRYRVIFDEECRSKVILANKVRNKLNMWMKEPGYVNKETVSELIQDIINIIE